MLIRQNPPTTQATNNGRLSSRGTQVAPSTDKKAEALAQGETIAGQHTATTKEDDPASYYSGSPTLREGSFFVEHPVIAIKVGTVEHLSTNISTNAARFAINSGLQENKSHEGSEVNAFRHTIWQATITVNYSATIAKQVGDAHEVTPSVDLSKRNFSGSDALSQADQTIDLLNNQLGRQIGSDNPKASMKEIAGKTLDYFHTHGLYTAVKQEDGSYAVQQTKLTDAQYKKAATALKNTNSNGFTPLQQKAATAAKQQQLQMDAQGLK